MEFPGLGLRLLRSGLCVKECEEAGLLEAELDE